VLLIEYGPGRGTMMADALRAAKAVPEFRQALRVHLIETSPNMQLRQRQTLIGVHDMALRWHAALEEVPDGPAIVLANEFFDALPVHQAERCATGWHERAIGINAGGELALTVASEPLAELERNLPGNVARAPIGAIFEWRDDRYAVEIAGRIAADGAALIVDYGHLRSSPGDTFQAVRSHRYASPMALPGLTDLTAHVDFDVLGRAARDAGARIHGPIEQGMFLKRLGIETRAAALQGGADEVGRAGITAALDRLIADAPPGMGTLFKAVGLSAPGVRELPGFEQ
jgi:NADH dehydrogenase [ubiquinone] 1 alpha subcomplex assembly factor 7